MNVTEGTRESHYITPPRRRRDCHFPSARSAPPMAHRRLLLALTVGLIARCVAGGGIGLEESRAADLEPGGDAHPRVPMSTPACVACERVAREIADAAARMDGEDETPSEAENARRASRRRRGFHGRSEAAVDAALDAVCETLARSRVVEDATTTTTTRTAGRRRVARRCWRGTASRSPTACSRRGRRHSGSTCASGWRGCARGSSEALTTSCE